MTERLRITILVDNYSNNPNIHTEHGLSLWIETDNHTIIFDTGQSNQLMYNARQCSIDLSKADTLILSHGHYDHTGGVSDLLAHNSSLSIYCHQGIFIPRFCSHENGVNKQIGIGKLASGALHRYIDTINWVHQPTEISDGITITGPIPRLTTYEDTGGSFFLDLESTQPDPLMDDLALWFTTDRGLIVVTGCCHSGLINTLTYIRSLTNNAPVYGIIGGFHLVNASQKRLEATCAHLLSLDVKKIIPCHCTSEHAVTYMRNQCGTIVEMGMAGNVYDFLPKMNDII